MKRLHATTVVARARSSRSRSSHHPSLARLGWDARLRRAYQRHDRPGYWPARVTRVEHGVCTLLGAQGVGRASLAGRMLVAAAADAARLPCPGDWVVVRSWPDGRVTIEGVLPRRGTLWRAEALESGSGPRAARPVASHVDVLITVDGAIDSTRLVDAIRALAAPGRTLGLVGADARQRARLLVALTGAAPLAGPGALVPLADGGAVIDTQAEHCCLGPDGVDQTLSVSFISHDLRRYPIGQTFPDRSVEPGVAGSPGPWTIGSHNA